MKKVVIILLVIGLFSPCFVYADDLDISPGAKSAILIDDNTGEVLYEKNKDVKTSVASLTKMMGLILIFERIDKGALNTSEMLTVSKNAKEMGGTQIWLEEGEKISVDDLLKGITMASANDAMVLMAERVSGTEEEFVKEMNDKAQDMGLKNTYFKNCTGFDEEGAYSTAYDMALIAKELLKHDKILNYTSKYEEYIRENTDNKTWVVNTNKLVKFYPGVDGLKTGFTDGAGSSIAVTAKKNNLRLIVVSFGYNNTNVRNSEASSMLDYGFNQYEGRTLLKKGKVIKSIKLSKADKSYVDLILNEDVNVTIKKGEELGKYNYDVKLNDIKFPIKKGDMLGSLYLKSYDKVILKSSLVSNNDINKASIFKQYIRTMGNFLVGDVN